MGEVAVLERDGGFVYYLITKSQYFKKPTYETLQSSLEAMRDHCLENKVTNVAMPRIGCGLDLLKWGIVVKMIKEVFGDCAMTITVYNLERC